jgi:hypothetical protein
MDAQILRLLATYPVAWFVGAMFVVALVLLVRAGLRKH